MKSKFFTFILIISVFSFCGADGISDYFLSRSVNVGFAFLKVNPDAFSQGMGGAGTALNFSSSSFLVNPALPSYMPDRSASFSYKNTWGFLNSSFISSSFPSSIGVFSGSFSFLVSDTIELRGLLPTEDPLGTYRFSSLSFALGYSREVLQGVYFGASARSISEFSYDLAKTSLTANAGFLVEFDRAPGLALGFSFLNIGVKTRYDAYSSDFIVPPFTVRAGVSYEAGIAGSCSLLPSIDFIKVNDQEYKVPVGIQFTYSDMLSVRGGYVFNDDSQTYSAGMGLKSGRFTIDYAVSYYRYSLGLDNMITVNYSF